MFSCMCKFVYVKDNSNSVLLLTSEFFQMCTISVAFTSQIVTLTASGLSNFAIHCGFFFLRLLRFLDYFV